MNKELKAQAKKKRRQNRKEKGMTKNNGTKKTIGIQQGIPNFIEESPRFEINHSFSCNLQEFFKESGRDAMFETFNAFKEIGAKFISLCLTPNGKGVAFFENYDDKTPMGIGIAA